MTNEFRDALDWLRIAEFSCERDMPHDDVITTLRRALLIADKLMQEPSDNMIKEAIKAYNATESNGKNDHNEVCAEFRAMRDQMLREVGE